MWNKIKELFAAKSDSTVRDSANSGTSQVYSVSVKAIVAITGSPAVRLAAADILKLYKMRNPTFQEFRTIASLRTSADFPPELSVSDFETIIGLVAGSEGGAALERCATIAQTVGVQSRDASGTPKRVPVVFLTYFGDQDDAPLLFYDHPMAINFVHPS